MTAYDDFYGRVSRGFGATGGAYTIVPGRHIGTDFPAAGGTFVPALRAGTVVNVVKTSTMSWGVITDVGNGNYISYWHQSASRVAVSASPVAIGSAASPAATFPTRTLSSRARHGRALTATLSSERTPPRPTRW